MKRFKRKVVKLQRLDSARSYHRKFWMLYHAWERIGFGKEVRISEYYSLCGLPVVDVRYSKRERGLCKR